MLWLRRMESPEVIPLPGTEAAEAPFWSPDSRQVAFFTEGRTISKISVSSGPPQIFANLPPGLSFGSDVQGAWSPEGVILIGRSGGAIYQVTAAGGEPRQLLKLDQSRGEQSQLSPRFLPDGRHFLYNSVAPDSGKGGVYVASLDGGQPQPLVGAASDATFVSPGFLLFARGSSLLGQHFDPRKRRLLGEPIGLGESVGQMSMYPVSLYSASSNGVLLYRSDVAANLQLTWADRGGKRTPVGDSRPYKQGSLAPDEKRLAAQIFDRKTAINDIWVLDLPTGILSRVTAEAQNANTPEWSPDGRESVYASNRSGIASLYRKVLGGGEAQPVLPSVEKNFPGEWLKDGSILYMNANGKTFFRLPAGKEAKPETLLATEYFKDEPRVSPDGRWVVYNTTESGRWEVYLASFPGFTERRQVSNNGGVQGYWRKDEKEIFYLALDGTLTSVPVNPGPPLETGTPQALFRTRIPVVSDWDQYAATGDGQRFLMFEVPESDERTLSLVLNWPALMRK